jgi:hypothetical protein
VDKKVTFELVYQTHGMDERTTAEVSVTADGPIIVLNNSALDLPWNLWDTLVARIEEARRRVVQDGEA